MIATQPPIVPPEGEFIRTLEPLLLALGGVMTLGLCIFLVWLVRTMLREDRATKREEAQRAAESTNDEESVS